LQVLGALIGMTQLFSVKDPGLGGDCIVARFHTIEDAIKCAEEVLEEYRKECRRNDEWSSDIDAIMVLVGKTVVARAMQCNVINRPDDVDEEGYSATEDLWFNSVDYYCDYEIKRVSNGS
jgi:hypothetical protein